MGDEDQIQGGDSTTSPAMTAEQAAVASLASMLPPPEQVRQTPEYLELQRQNRELARQAGSARAEAERLKSAQEAQRQAAEAQRAQAIQQQMVQRLGADAPAFAELASLLSTDPVKAAERFAEMRQAQSPAGQQAATQPSQPQAGAPVSQQVPPFDPGVGVQAGAPIGAAPMRTIQDQADAYDAAFQKVVADNLNLQTRSRVRMRDRANAIGNYLKGELLRNHGVDPDLYFRDR